MAIVMDMCSGEVEMRFTSDANQGEQALLSGRSPGLNMSEAPQLAMVQATVTPSEHHTIPVFLMSMDVEVFLRTMHKHS